MSFYFIHNHTLITANQPPEGAQPLAQLGSSLLPPIVTELHQNLREWSTLGKRPGAFTADRVWATPTGTLVVDFAPGQAPLPLPLPGNAGRDLAAWLVLLDKWMETFVVIARARTVWTPNELASALIFVNPMWLPPALVAQQPDNWLRVARALAVAVADGPVQGKPTNRHWQREQRPQPNKSHER